MDIRQLQTQDLRYAVPSVHSRLAVIKASSEQRAALIKAQSLTHAVLVGRQEADDALVADSRSRQAAHALAVESQQESLARAATNLGQAQAREAEADTTRLAAAETLADFDSLAAGATEANRSRDEAWTDRRRALSQLVDAVDQLERVQHQRRDAAATFMEAQAQVADSRPQARSSQGRSAQSVQELQAHIAAVHAALDKAETERQSDAAIATEELMSAMSGVALADEEVSRLWARLDQVVPPDLFQRWGRGHLEPGMIAEHRDSLLAAGAEADWNHSGAGVAVLAATRHHDIEELKLDELDGPQAEPSRLVDALRAWLSNLAETAADTGADALVLDDALGGVDAPVRDGLLDTLVTLSATTQLLYFTDQLDVVAWAISLPDDVGGLNHVATTERPAFALND